ncbi:MAG: 16S rRNA (uracil(1498)-N(3))-methyltransferase [Deinococcus sp.]|nr:16S rRNA (uracil(1498)-N(3))-methyltransferase [Deinococcus sp.]
MRAHRFFCLELAAGLVRLSGAEAHHLRHVLRLRPGQWVVLFDGQGKEAQALIESIHQGQVQLLAQEPQWGRGELPVAVHVLQGVVKGDKFTTIAQQAAELGASSLTPVFTARGEVDSPSPLRQERWQRAALSGAKSSRRAVLMDVRPALPLAEALCQPGPSHQKLLAWEDSQQPWPALASTAAVWLLIGPEGGLEPEEAALAEQHGFKTFSLGPRILRAETAAATALAVLGFLLERAGLPA